MQLPAGRCTWFLSDRNLANGRTIWDWAILLGLAVVNPFDKVRDFDIPDRGHVPWPSWVVDQVRAHAWPDLVRMVTCQRGSDLIRIGPEHRDRNGIWCRPKKTRKRRRAFHIPLASADALEIDRWAETPVTFTNSRWLKPIERFRDDLYLYSPKAAQYTPDGLRARWGRWLADTPEGRAICRRWKECVGAQVRWRANRLILVGVPDGPLSQARGAERQVHARPGHNVPRSRCVSNQEKQSLTRLAGLCVSREISLLARGYDPFCLALG